jgi:hypothetical protein
MLEKADFGQNVKQTGRGLFRANKQQNAGKYNEHTEPTSHISSSDELILYPGSANNESPSIGERLLLKMVGLSYGR